MPTAYGSLSCAGGLLQQRSSEDACSFSSFAGSESIGGCFVDDGFKANAHCGAVQSLQGYSYALQLLNVSAYQGQCTGGQCAEKLGVNKPHC